MMKNSRQRNSIKQLLVNRCDHPTAAELYEDARKIYPNISLGTVYRNLNLMVELGEIRKVDSRSDADRYDGNMEPHFHHVCRICGAVHDVMLPQLHSTMKMAAEVSEDVIESYDMTFLGVCRQCRAKDAEESV